MDTQESESLIHDTTCFPRRVILAILWCLGLFVVYILRVILSVAAIPICADNHWDDNTKVTFLFTISDILGNHSFCFLLGIHHNSTPCRLANPKIWCQGLSFC